MIERICKFFLEHHKFSVVGILLTIILGTAISVDKSFDILRLRAEISTLKKDLAYANSQIAEFKMANDTLQDKYKDSENRFIEDKQDYLKKESDFNIDKKRKDQR